jgi:hypothetical protein
LLHKELNAIGLGSLAAQTLNGNSGSEIVGEIVSVFPNSLYIRTTNGELVFVTSRHLKSPITVNLDSRTDLKRIVRPHDAVSLAESGIRIGSSLFVDLSRAVLCKPHTTPRVHQLAITKPTLHLASLILIIVDNSLSALDPAALAHAGASKFVSDGVLPFLRTNDMSAFESAALRIVGLGTGFTPSGDDLLGGFLATYNGYTQLTRRQTMDLTFHALENRTHWISAKLLDYMQRQILDEEVSTLIESSGSQDNESFILALETLLARGHTSGIDILVGVLLALGLIHDIAEKDNMTTDIVKSLSLFA